MPIISKITLPDNTTYDVTDGRGMFVGSCSTSAATQTKDVSISADQNFVLRIGAVIAVKFTYSNTYKSTTSAPCKLNVNGTGAKNIYWVNTATPNNTTSTIAFGTAGYYHFYLYDGSNWVWVGYSNESNTTYSGMTVAEIEAGTSSTGRLISPANLKLAVETWSPSYTKSEMDSVISRIDTVVTNLQSQQTKDEAALINLINSNGKNGLLITAPNHTHNGITFTVNSDGTVTANGTATANAYIQVASIPADSELFDGSYRLCGCPTGGSRQSYAMYAALSSYARYDYGESVSLIPTEGLTGNVGIVIMIYAGYTANNVIFKPMICKAVDYLVSPEYAPYCPTLSELYAMIQALQS